MCSSLSSPKIQNMSIFLHNTVVLKPIYYQVLPRLLFVEVCPLMSTLLYLIMNSLISPVFTLIDHSLLHFSILASKTSLYWSPAGMSSLAWISGEERAALSRLPCVYVATQRGIAPGHKGSIAEQWLADSCGSGPATGGGSRAEWALLLTPGSRSLLSPFHPHGTPAPDTKAI